MRRPFGRKRSPGEGNDAIANGRCYFQMAIAAKWQQEGMARAEISDLRPLVPSQLHSTPLHSWSSPSAQTPTWVLHKKFQTICMLSTVSCSKRQFALACRFAAWCHSDPATWLLLFLSLKPHNFLTSSLPSTHYINFHIEGVFFHQEWNKTWPYSRALLVKEPCWTVTGTKYTPFSSHQSSHNIHFLETLHISKRVWIYKSSY